MSRPSEQFIIMDKFGKRVNLEIAIQELIKQKERILVNDEIGVVLYVGDLELYNLTPSEDGIYLASKITEIRKSRFSTAILRKQIGATVLSVTADSVFIVRDGNSLKKVRAEKLVPGMILASGEKVFK